MTLPREVDGDEPPPREAMRCVPRAWFEGGDDEPAAAAAKSGGFFGGIGGAKKHKPRAPRYCHVMSCNDYVVVGMVQKRKPRAPRSRSRSPYTLGYDGGCAPRWLRRPSPGATHGRTRAQRPSHDATHGRTRAQRPSPHATRHSYSPLLRRLLWDDTGTGGRPGAVWAIGGFGLLAASQGHAPPTREPGAALELKVRGRRDRLAVVAAATAVRVVPSSSSSRSAAFMRRDCPFEMRASRGRNARAGGERTPSWRAAKTCAFVCALAQRLLGPAGVSSFSRRATHRAHAASARA